MATLPGVTAAVQRNTGPPPTASPAPVLPIVTTAPPYIRQTTAKYNAPVLRHISTALPYMSESTTAGHTVAEADNGYYLATLGGVLLALILVCVGLLVLVYMTRQKGSYQTNEADDEASAGSETALRSDAAPDTVEEE